MGYESLLRKNWHFESTLFYIDFYWCLMSYSEKNHFYDGGEVCGWRESELLGTIIK